MSDHFELTADERGAVLPSGRQRQITNRVGWITTHLVQGGLLERPARADLRIANRGRAVLVAHPDRGVNARIELIDGARLAGLMLRHGVGVQPETTVTLHQLDEDLFETFRAQLWETYGSKMGMLKTCIG